MYGEGPSRQRQEPELETLTCVLEDSHVIERADPKKNTEK